MRAALVFLACLGCGSTAMKEEAQRPSAGGQAPQVDGQSIFYDDGTLKGHLTQRDYVIAGDQDSDGLPDAEEDLRGTEKTHPDSDGDALLDGWEVYGVDGVDLAALGASPDHKDVFVEMDYMRRSGDTANGGRGVLAPSDDVIARIVQEFADAPVENLDGIDGIALHLLLDEEIPHVATLLNWYVDIGLLKATNFDTSRARCFHYMVWADTYMLYTPQYPSGTKLSSGISTDIPGQEFIVTLGAWTTQGGTDNEKVGTFLHELGHNLGLMHGGSDHLHNKPNHLSVMNYFWQTTGVPYEDTTRFTYQMHPLPVVKENAPDEEAGLGKRVQLKGWITSWFQSGTSKGYGDASESIDWNGVSGIEGVIGAMDLNGDGNKTELLPVAEEWRNLAFHGGYIGRGVHPNGIEAGRDNPVRRGPPQNELDLPTERRLRTLR